MSASDLIPKFPTVCWAARQATFVPSGHLVPPNAACEAALVFAFYQSRLVLAHIAGRGWCIPSGRLEVGEDPDQAARREAWEEAGLTLDPLYPLGSTLFGASEDHFTAFAANYVAEVLAFAPIPSGTESLGIRLVEREELPACYFTWNPLLEAIFAYAWSFQEQNATK